MNNGKWTAFAISYMCVFAYAVCFCMYQIGSLFTGGFNWWEPFTAAIAFAIIGFVIYLLIRKDPNEMPKTEKKEAKAIASKN